MTLLANTARYVRHELVLDHARLGWIIGDDLADVHHGQYGVLMLWLCDCEPATFKSSTNK